MYNNKVLFTIAAILVSIFIIVTDTQMDFAVIDYYDW